MQSMGTRSIRSRVAGFASLAAVAAFATTVSAAPPRVPGDFFGTNLQNSYTMTAEVRERHVERIAGTGMTQVRLPIPWSMIEPKAPVGGAHTYQWSEVDIQIRALARSGLRAQSLFAYAPPWAASGTPSEISQCRNRGSAGLGAGTPVGYAAAARAVVRRYGPGGSFWESHPALDPRPVRMHEIWNAPNTAGTWCPRVDPEGYAVLFSLAEESIHAEDPGAQVVIGGMGTGARTQGGSVSTPEYLRRMVAARPSIRTSADAMAIHLYPGKALASQLNGVPKFRQWLREATLPDSLPMLLNEIGFSRAGDIDMTEDERVASYANVMSKLPRTNCNLNGVLQYTWTTRDQNTSDAEDMFGIAHMGSAELYDSGREYVHWTQVFRGESTDDPPTATHEICPGMPKPDQDGDGVRDENDHYPLDPERSEAGGGSGGGGSGGGGSGVGGGSGSGPAARAACGARLAALTAKVAATTGSEQRALARRYKRASRRCVPCKRKQARVKRKLKRADAATRPVLRSRLRRLRRRCAPCERKLRRLELATLGATSAERAYYLKRHEQVRTRCTGRRR